MISCHRVVNFSRFVNYILAGSLLFYGVPSQGQSTSPDSSYQTKTARAETTSPQPELNKLNATKPQLTELDATKPQLTELDVAQLDVAKLEPAEFETLRQQASNAIDELENLEVLNPQQAQDLKHDLKSLNQQQLQQIIQQVKNDFKLLTPQQMQQLRHNFDEMLAVGLFLNTKHTGSDFLKSFAFGSFLGFMMVLSIVFLTLPGAVYNGGILFALGLGAGLLVFYNHVNGHATSEGQNNKNSSWHSLTGLALGVPVGVATISAWMKLTNHLLPTVSFIGFGLGGLYLMQVPTVQAEGSNLTPLEKYYQQLDADSAAAKHLEQFIH